jgi:hypothetical protein
MPKTRISCPNCRQPITADVDQLVDVGVDPSMKEKFLSGAINFIKCQFCKYQGQLSSVLVYHDPDKELLLTFVPPEMGIPRDEQERIIGGLINQSINRLPQEKRKGYLLRPQQTLTMQGLIERVLEADGITKEMIESQQKKLLLLQRLIDASPDAMVEIVKQEDVEINGEFFALLKRLAEIAAMSQEQESIQKLTEVQKYLVGNTTYGKLMQERSIEWGTALKELQAEGDQLTREKLLELVINASSDLKIQAYVSFARPLMDYEFFTMLSGRIDRSRGDGRDRLANIRENLLTYTRQIDQEMEARQVNAQRQLNELLKASNIKEATEAALPEIDDFFGNAVNLAMDAARKSGDLEKIGKLQIIIDVLKEASAPPPEVNLIKELLSAQNEKELVDLLNKHEAEITPEFIDVLASFANQIQSQEEDAEVVQQIIRLHRVVVRYSMSRNLRK